MQQELSITPSQLKAILSKSMAAHQPLLVTGAPGVGKTSIVKECCDEYGFEMILSHPVVSDPTDYKGLPFMKDGEAHFMPFSDLQRLITATKPTCFFLDDLGQASPAVQSSCFPANTMINTESGSRQIQDIQEGDRVITDSGEIEQVTEVFRRQYNGDMYKIKPVSLLPIEATEEHPFLVIESRKKRYVKTDNGYELQAEIISDPVWKAAKDIEKGEYVAVPIIKPSISDETILIEKKGSITRYIDLTPDFAKFIGYYVGNGCYSQHKAVQRVEVTLNDAHKEKIKDIEKLYNNLFETRIFTRTIKNCYKIAIHDPSLGEFLHQCCGKDAYEKKVPDFILYHKNKDLIVAFLIGYLNTDGAIAQDKGKVRGVQYSTVSHTLAMQVQQLFARLGVLAGLKHSPGAMRVLRGKECDCVDSYSMNCYDNEACKKLGIETNKIRTVVWAFFYADKLWTQVRSVEKTPFSGIVYNFEVEKRHTYTVNNCIVHNCMQLLLSRQINGFKISDQVTFIAATNRKKDKAGVIGMLEPVKSRFSTILNLDVDLNDWVLWALRSNIPTELIAFLRFRPNFLIDFQPTADLTNSPSPRTIANVAAHMQMGHSEDVEYIVYAGAAGEAFAGELMGFLKIFRRLPDPDAVLMNPTLFDYNPEEPAVAYALNGAITKRATKDNFDRVVAYSERLPKEFAVMLVRDCINTNFEVTQSRAYIDWCSKNTDVLL